MSGSRRTEDLQSVKTRALIIQNPDGSFPPVNSVLAFEDSRGGAVPTQNLQVSNIVVNDTLYANPIEFTDGSGTHLLQSIDGNLYYDNSLLAKADDNQTIGAWSEYPAIQNVDMNNNDIVNADAVEANVINLVDAQGVHTLQSINGNIYFDDQRLAKADDKNSSDWASYPASGTVNMNNNSIADANTVNANMVETNTIQLIDNTNVPHSLTSVNSGLYFDGALLIGEWANNAATQDVDMATNSITNAGSVTAGRGILNDAAITANGDIVASSANMYVTGDQNLTGSIQAEYLTLRDPVNANALTYQWVNNNDLLWEDGASNVLNISQAVKNQSVAQTITLATDLTLRQTLNTLLQFFSDKGIFINTVQPTPPTISFNSPCSIQFNIYANTDPGTVVKSVQYGPSPATIDISVLCTTLTALLAPYASFTFSPTAAQATLTVNAGYSMSISDVNWMGEATRFAAHLNMKIDAYSKFNLSIQGDSFITTPPNTDAPLTGLAIALSNVFAGSAVLTITPPTAPVLTPPNALQYYSIYLDGAPVDIISSTQTTYTLIFAPSNTPVSKTVNVYAIDLYNQSAPATVPFTPLKPLIVWPPAGYVNGFILNGSQNQRSPLVDFLANLIPYKQYGPEINNTYTFTIIPHVTLENICIRINVDDGATITFTGTKPTSTYIGAGLPPDPLVIIPGPQPCAGSGGNFQYSYPITLVAGVMYDVKVTYYNTIKTTCCFQLAYVIPDSPPSGPNVWTPARNYVCPTLDNLKTLNLSQFCFINTTTPT